MGLLLPLAPVTTIQVYEVVPSCTNLYKITDNPFVIRFLPQTTIDEVAPIINLQKFMLRKFEHLQALDNTNLELPDVVGMIRSVQGSDLSDATVMTRVVVRFVIEPKFVPQLHPSHEILFRHESSSHHPEDQLVNLFLALIPRNQSRKRNMSPLEISTNSSPTLMSRPKKQSSSARLECLRFSNRMGGLLYRVELSVDDGNDNATFVVLDREMLNLIKKDAATLTVKEVCLQKT
ncbi:hypothetical protein YC2023_042006 [Brassica napus]